ncbi:MAG: phosphoglycerate dehydrogenase [Pseudomonadales bacterium]|nr:phosphoglycerate dehydrogenase [Pseudomonadales bacterium]
MIEVRDQIEGKWEEMGITPHYADVVQTLTEEELIENLPEYDGWIIGDDPATRDVLAAGRQGKLKVAVKWGVGVDNVDFDACRDLGIAVSNTPAMFGREVADIALGYLIGLARHTFRIDREVRDGAWPKYRGVSLLDKVVGLVGFGDIGRQLFKRLEVLGCSVTVYDPYIPDADDLQGNIVRREWPDGLGDCDFLVFTCALTNENFHMFDEDAIASCKRGVRVVNVSRGGLVDQTALIDGLKSGQIHSVALDVFEDEPPQNTELFTFENCVYGSHNASNTEEAVLRTSLLAIEKMTRDLRSK